MNLCIIQARMGSTRLPGKVLREVNGKSILQNVIDRLSPSSLLDKIVVATSTNSEDQAIEDFCLSKKILCSRGSDWDVLDRFYQTALEHGAKSGDKVVDFVVGQFKTLGVDYFSNSNQEPDYLEDGFDTEVTTFDALKTAWTEATLLSEREHVMPFIKNSGQFSLGWRKANARYLFKLSVDTEADLQVAQIIFERLHHNPEFSIDEVVELLDKEPGILELNKNSIINSGYTKSLNEDRIVK
jgi:spore coat polysaccharide biosynthesis protein SpsF (cytidylyltransferase family)